MVSRERSTHVLYCPPGPRVTAAKHPPPSALATAKSSPFPGRTSRSRCSGDSFTRALLLSSRKETNYRQYVNKVNDQACCVLTSASLSSADFASRCAFEGGGADSWFWFIFVSQGRQVVNGRCGCPQRCKCLVDI